jgi:hypothetical protein
VTKGTATRDACAADGTNDANSDTPTTAAIIRLNLDMKNLSLNNLPGTLPPRRGFGDQNQDGSIVILLPLVMRIP